MQRESSLDIARAVSMLYIIGVWHLNNYTDSYSLQPYGEYIKNAALGLFMFLSGYLLGGRYIIKDRSSAYSFFKKRIFRIFPLFAVSLIISYAIGKIAFSTLFLGLTGISVFIPPLPLTLWFVSMIVVFYMLFPLLSGKSKKQQIFISLAITVIALLWTVYFGGLEKRFVYYFPCFALGVIIADIKICDLLNLKRAVICLLIFVLLSVVYELWGLNWADWRFIIGRPFIALSGAAVIIVMSMYLSKIRGIARISVPIAYASMCAYLFHRVIFKVFRDDIYWPEDGWMRLLYLSAVCLPVIISVGYLVQYIYDKIISKISVKAGY